MTASTGAQLLMPRPTAAAHPTLITGLLLPTNHHRWGTKQKPFRIPIPLRRPASIAGVSKEAPPRSAALRTALHPPAPHRPRDGKRHYDLIATPQPQRDQTMVAIIDTVKRHLLTMPCLLLLLLLPSAPRRWTVTNYRHPTMIPRPFPLLLFVLVESRALLRRLIWDGSSTRQRSVLSPATTRAPPAVAPPPQQQQQQPSLS